MKKIITLFVLIFFSSFVFADVYKNNYGVSGMVAQSQQAFPTVAVYNACKNKQVSEFDKDMTEDRIETGKCTLNYPKYCNAARMSTVEDCVRCKHISCPAGTYCDTKRRQCKKGEAPPEAVIEKPKPVIVEKPAPIKPKLPEKITIKNSLETVAKQPVIIVAPDTDNAAAQYIGVSLESAGGKVVYSKNTIGDISDFNGKHIIVVGGPCANMLWTKFSDETCSTWDYQRKGLIKSKRVNDNLGILLAGTSTGDTFALANVLIAQYKTDPSFGETEYKP